jgi:hypothetical protein
MVLGLKFFFNKKPQFACTTTMTFFSFSCERCSLQLAYTLYGGVYIMDDHNLQELRRIVKPHEEMVQGNIASIFFLYL